MINVQNRINFASPALKGVFLSLPITNVKICLYFHAAGSIKKGSDFNLTKLIAKFWNIYSYFYRIEVEITMARDVEVPSDKVHLQITKVPTKLTISVSSVVEI